MVALRLYFSANIVKIYNITLGFNLFLRHHLGLQLLGGEGFLLRLHSEYGVQLFTAPYLSVLRCQFPLLFHSLIVIVVIALVKQHKRYPILGVKKPVAEPRP